MGFMVCVDCLLVLDRPHPLSLQKGPDHYPLAVLLCRVAWVLVFSPGIHRCVLQSFAKLYFFTAAQDCPRCPVSVIQMIYANWII